jgi:hypothetical protein
VFSLSSEKIVTYRKDGSAVKSRNNYEDNDSLKKSGPGALRTLKFEQIQSVHYLKVHPVSNVGGAIASLGAFSALVLAPLFSLNFKSGDIDNKKYFSVLTQSGVVFAAGVTLHFAFRKSKHYLIRSSLPLNDKKKYYRISDK